MGCCLSSGSTTQYTHASVAQHWSNTRPATTPLAVDARNTGISRHDETLTSPMTLEQQQQLIFGTTPTRYDARRGLMHSTIVSPERDWSPGKSIRGGTKADDSGFSR